MLSDVSGVNDTSSRRLQTSFCHLRSHSCYTDIPWRGWNNCPCSILYATLHVESADSVMRRAAFIKSRPSSASDRYRNTAVARSRNGAPQPYLATLAEYVYFDCPPCKVHELSFRVLGTCELRVRSKAVVCDGSRLNGAMERERDTWNPGQCWYRVAVSPARFLFWIILSSARRNCDTVV